MEISIFEAVGPIMVGPSSSHTAGAARLGRMAAKLVEGPFTHVDFGLHGSFAKTYQGHGTDLALVAGVLGFRQDDERLRDAFSLAKERGITYTFYETEIGGAHENTVCMSFSMTDGSTREIIGSSIGGGQIKICSIDGFPLEMSLNMTTLIIMHKDAKGVIYQITRALAANDINIATMKLNRQEKGALACCVIETDSDIPDAVVEELKMIEAVYSVKEIN
ncbi:MAG: L-serine ammonia-lyase, iron-sulfur-dependent, subunit beta [Lachnospiraceae bacterium]|nr:L-serine ammonia-lyase, iron-sulfur-dependent, subunit beta [Lachnospiraceae bacterium]